ncbi:MAG: DUF448 domain-containing protein [Campylobacterales bacterium]|nr:DUF448 domain-containing protein [Campylobacterales bacterium]
MSKNFHQPTRMCVSCRTRTQQHSLLRLSCVDGDIVLYSGTGRSFYLCSDCQEDEKKISKALMRQCRSNKKEQLMNKLKEIVTYDR